VVAPVVKKPEKKKVAPAEKPRKQRVKSTDKFPPPKYSSPPAQVKPYNSVLSQGGSPSPQKRMNHYQIQRSIHPFTAVELAIERASKYFQIH